MKKLFQKTVFSLLLLLFVCSVSKTQPVWGAPANYRATMEQLIAGENARLIYSFLTTEMKLNSAAACGILANIYHESGFRPTAEGDKGTSYGLCQWHDMSPGVGRKTGLINWCAQNGFDHTTILGQMNYLRYELSANNSQVLWNGRTIYNYMLGIENSAAGAYEAGRYWCYYFEVPSKKEQASALRGTFAQTNVWPVYYLPAIQSVTSTSEGILLEWSAYTGACAYEVYRMQDYDPNTLTLIHATDQTFFLDTGVNAASVYTYAFFALSIPPGIDLTQLTDADITRTASNVVNARYLTAPAISGIIATPTYTEVTWQPVFGASQYLVYRTENGGEYQPLAATADCFFRDTSAIVPDIKYSYRVYAAFTDDFGNTMISPVSSTLSAFALAQPQIAIANSKTGIRVSWEAISHAKQYIVYRSIEDGDYEEVARVKGCAYTDKTAEEGIRYRYKVCAYYETEAGVKSISKFSPVKIYFWLTTPTLSSVKTASSRTLQAKWDENQNATGYQLQFSSVKNNASRNKSFWIVTNDTTSWKMSSLTKGRTYYVRVRSYYTYNNKKYYSAWSPCVSAKVTK